MPSSRVIYEFGPFVLDPTERRLSRDGQPVAVTPKVFDLLVLLVERRGRLLEKNVLLSALWPEAFVEEANLSVNVSSLRRALGEPASGGEYIETVPRRGYRFVGGVMERRLDEGSAGPAPIPSPPAAPFTTTPRASLAGWHAWALLALVLIGAAAWATWSVRSRGPQRVGAAADVRSLAILPFLPLNGVDEADSLGVGMADALITKLSNLQQISVRPTSSVLAYGKASRDALAVGRALGVDGVLEGHVQRAESSIRVTVQLLSVRDGVPLWADRFDDAVSNLFAMQDSISEQMAIALSLTLSGSDRRKLTKRFTRNTAAYEEYQLAQFYLARGTPDTVVKAIELFEQALAKDPTYAAAYAGLATARITTASGGHPDDYLEAGRYAAEALRLDPDLADAHQALGWVAMFAQWNWQAAESSFRRAIALSRAAPMPHLALSTLFSAHARHGDAIREMELARQIDPASSAMIRNLAWTYSQARQYDAAERWCRRALEMDPADSRAHRDLARALVHQKRFDDAIVEIEAARSLGRDLRIELAVVHTLAGHAREAAAAYDGAVAPGESFERAVLHASRGQYDRAFEELAHAVREKNGRVPWIGVDPDLDRLRGDARFEGFLRQIHLDDLIAAGRKAVSVSP